MTRALQVVAVHFQPGWAGLVGGGVAGRQNADIVLAALANFNGVAGRDGERRNVDLLAVHDNVTVADHLAALGAAGGNTHAVDDVVQALFEHREHVLTGDALFLDGLLVKVAELAFENAVVAACFLLFAKLQAVADNLRFLASLPCWPGTKLRFSMAHFSVWQRSPFRNNFMPSRRQSRHTGPL